MQSFGTMHRSHQALLGAGGVLFVLEVVDAFRIEQPAFALVFAGLVLAGLAWTWFGGIGGPILVSLLALNELAGVAFLFTRPTNAFEVTVYIVFGVLSALVTAAGIAAILASVKAKRAKPEASAAAKA